MTKRKVENEKKPGLYWCETGDHEEDWFMFATSERHARKQHAGEEGYMLRDVKAHFVAPIPESIDRTEGWPDDEELVLCGGVFLPRAADEFEAHRQIMGSGGRVVQFGDKIYAEGDIVTVCAKEQGRIRSQ